MNKSITFKVPITTSTIENAYTLTSFVNIDSIKLHLRESHACFYLRIIQIMRDY